MPRLGSGLSLGTINRLAGFDFDASSYIIANNIPNSTSVITTNNNYLEFPSTGSYLEYTSSMANFNNLKSEPSTILTFSCWVNPSNYSDRRYVFAKEVEYAIRLKSATEIEFAWGNGTGGGWGMFNAYSITGTTIPTNQWSHIVLTLDRVTSGNKLKAWVNNVSILNVGVTFSSNSWSANNDPMTIGWKNPIQTNQQFIGGIKNFGIWNRELTSSEISYLYNSGNGRSINSFGISATNGVNLKNSSLKFFWPFNEETTSLIKCFTGTGNSRNSSFTSSTGSVSINTSESTISYVNPQNLINTFVVGVKNLNLWSNFACWNLRQSFRSSLNSVPSLGGLGSFTGSSVNNPQTLINGMMFNGTNQYFNTNFNPVSASLSTSNINMGIVIPSDNGFSNGSSYHQFFGNETAGSWTNATGIASTGDTIYYFVASTSIGTIGDSFQSGLLAVEAPNSSTTLNYIKNGSVFNSQSASRGSFYNGVVYVGGGRSGPNFGYASDILASFFYVFSTSLTSQQKTDFYNLYKSTLGVGLVLE